MKVILSDNIVDFIITVAIVFSIIGGIYSLTYLDRPHCPYCGNELHNTLDPFCSKCGNKLDTIWNYDEHHKPIKFLKENE